MSVRRESRPFFKASITSSVERVKTILECDNNLVIRGILDWLIVLLLFAGKGCDLSMQRIKAILEGDNDFVVRGVLIRSSPVASLDELVAGRVVNGSNGFLTTVTDSLDINAKRIESVLQSFNHVVVGGVLNRYHGLLGGVLTDSIDVNAEGIKTVLQSLEDLIILLWFDNGNRLFSLTVTAVVTAVADGFNVGTHGIKTGSECLEDLIVCGQVGRLVGHPVHASAEVIKTIVQGVKDFTGLGARSENLLLHDFPETVANVIVAFDHGGEDFIPGGGGWVVITRSILLQTLLQASQDLVTLKAQLLDFDLRFVVLPSIPDSFDNVFSTQVRQVALGRLIVLDSSSHGVVDLLVVNSALLGVDGSSRLPSVFTKNVIQLILHLLKSFINNASDFIFARGIMIF
ncbi:hypothetical protein HG530_004342 [Fusarium avenaceum]|nr:hypothetical protein HG530_004342 [Fusarium avenaceum]